ncbi:hypothetical protein [Govanella unica]|uniref:Uncharacterized protein n=1 Tax=Govanella unica TaxID=2975056 RepID=A0A9X3Z7U7_9PROT|nr:hypothetical protein [Govania unica]MDA5194521.1 hypothetical protein [Govania unica]
MLNRAMQDALKILPIKLLRPCNLCGSFTPDLMPWRDVVSAAIVLL